MNQTWHDSGRWRSFSFAQLGLQACVSFAAGVAAAVTAALAFSPEPEAIGRVGLGLFIGVALAITPLLFTLGFMAAETARPHRSPWGRALSSAICGCLYVGGFLFLSWAAGGINNLWSIPEFVGMAVRLAY